MPVTSETVHIHVHMKLHQLWIAVHFLSHLYLIHSATVQSMCVFCRQCAAHLFVRSEHLEHSVFFRVLGYSTVMVLSQQP